MDSNSTVVLRLIGSDDQESDLLAAADRLHKAAASPGLYFVDASVLGRIPGSPLAYWVTDSIRDIFQRIPQFQQAGRVAQFGASTKNDLRYLRAWWETQPHLSARSREETLIGKRWVPFAKGGSSLSFYRDFELVIDWKEDGSALKRDISEYRGSRGWGYHWTAALNGHAQYFRPGLTWSRRASSLAFRILPSGCIFGDKGPAAFAANDDPTELMALAGMLNSTAFIGLTQLKVARVSLAQSFEVGLIQQVPVPDLVPSNTQRLGHLAQAVVDIRRRLDGANESSHVFRLPALLIGKRCPIAEDFAEWEQVFHDSHKELARIQAEINEASSSAYEMSQEDIQAIAHSFGTISTSGSEDVDNGESTGALDEPEDEVSALDQTGFVSDLLSYAVGVTLGRWDVRMALDHSLASALQEPFDPLPICCPGMLVGPDGLPARRANIVSEPWLRARPTVISLPPERSVAEPVIPAEAYPLRIDWDGILVDDEGHEDDVVRRVRDVLTLLWGERAEAIEQEACAILGVRGLRDYFRNPKHFWGFHVKRYSKSRRKAPIYWLLQSSKRAYGLWLYYPRLDADTLFKALGYVGNRLLLEQGRLEEALAQRRAIGDGDGRTRRELDKRIEACETFVSEVSAFRAELQRVADLGLTVDHDDGVLLSIAPLHNLVPWPPAKTAWNELMAGKYGWSSIGTQLRAKGLVRESAGG